MTRKKGVDDECLFVDMFHVFDLGSKVEATVVCLGSTPHPVIGDKQSIHLCEGANTNLYFPLLNHVKPKVCWEKTKL